MPLWQHSPVTRVLEAVFRALKRLSLERRFVPPTREDIHLLPDAERDRVARIRMGQIDRYVVGWLTIECAMLVVMTMVDPLWRILLIIPGYYRLIDIIQSVVNITIFDGLRIQARHEAANIERIILLQVLNYLEVLLCFGILYFGLSLLSQPGALSSLYFSAVTQTTLGYGDVQPIGIGRSIAAVHAVVGFLFGAVLLARFIALLQPIGSSDRRRLG